MATHDSLGCPFNQLPVELKELVWWHSLPGDVSEVAVYPSGLRPNIPLGLPPHHDDEDLLLIRTAYPVLMHVCREWRAFAMARTKLRYSPVAMMEVPTRTFRPDLDILYLPAQGFTPVWFHARLCTIAARQVAMAPQVFLDCGAGSLALLTYFRHLEALTIVLPRSAGQLRLSETFTPPTRRCKLRPVSAAPLDDPEVLSVVLPGCRQPVKTSAFLRWIEEALHRTAQYLMATAEREPEATRARSRGVQPWRFQAHAQTIVEYHLRDGRPQWLENRGGAA